jgi:hypothetical protein
VDRLGKLLNGVVARQPASSAVTEIRARIELAEILGPALAGQLAEVTLRGSSLTIATANPALAHQLRLDATLLLERLNGRGLGRRLRELRVRTGRG